MGSWFLIAIAIGVLTAIRGVMDCGLENKVEALTKERDYLKQKIFEFRYDLSKLDSVDDAVLKLSDNAFEGTEYERDDEFWLNFNSDKKEE